jgi:hypothetical protein
MAGTKRSAKPRDGAVFLAEVRAPTLSIGCERCGRYGRYDVQRLIAVHGADAKLPELLVTLANWGVRILFDQLEDGVNSALGIPQRSRAGKDWR